MTLEEYANARNNVILFYVSASKPFGHHVILGYPNLDFVDRFGLLNLNGTVDKDGDWEWEWNNECKPVVIPGDSLIKLQAYQNARKYETLINNYQLNNRHHT